MKPVLNLFILLITCCLLAGCNETDINPSDNERVAVNFGMATIASTRVSPDGNEWTRGDSIGIIMVESGKGIGAVIEGGDNVKFRQYLEPSKEVFFTRTENRSIIRKMGGR